MISKHPLKSHPRQQSYIQTQLSPVMINRKVADILYEIADVLELQGVAFKPRAYTRAARNIESMKEDLAEYYEEGNLQDIEGVGKAIEDKIIEIIETGKLEYLDNLYEETPKGLIEVMRVPDIGPKKAKKLYDELGVEDLEGLRKKAEKGEIVKLKGFGERTEEKIIKGIGMLEAVSGRHLMHEMIPLAQEIIEHIAPHADKIETCGSLRRWKETIGDLDILAAGDTEAIMNALVGFPHVEEVLASGDTKTSVRLTGGIQADVRVVDHKSFGAALQYFTGSKEHNVRLRQYAIDKGYKLNEYGLYDKNTEEMIAGEIEEVIYETLGMPWIPPELREDHGEIDAALEDRLPELITPDDIKGDLQTHSNWSDGGNTIKELVSEAESRGYRYIAITDHSQGLIIANGLSAMELEERMEEIRRVQENTDVRILNGIEVDIKKDGSLDMATDVLEDLDIVLGAVHSNFAMDAKEQTARITDAFSTGLIDIFAHPTGRKIGEREPYGVNLNEIISAAVDYDVALEINASPVRLDLGSLNARRAMEAGAKISIGTDAHGLQHMEFMKYGVGIARRAWLEKKDVINTLSYNELKKYLEER